VQRVAQHYLQSNNRTLGQFVPTAKPQRAVVPPTPDLAGMLADYQGKAAVAQGEAFHAIALAALAQANADDDREVGEDNESVDQEGHRRREDFGSY
jgi:hypothetical protein